MNCCCENCGWSEIVGSTIMCNYNGYRTWNYECCEAWKPKNIKNDKDTVEVVRCKNCKYGYVYYDGYEPNGVVCDGAWHDDVWFCADGKRRDDDA